MIGYLKVQINTEAEMPIEWTQGEFDSWQSKFLVDLSRRHEEYSLLFVHSEAT